MPITLFGFLWSGMKVNSVIGVLLIMGKELSQGEACCEWINNTEKNDLKHLVLSDLDIFL